MRTQLISELNDLVSIRMAVVLAPALQTLVAVGREALAERLEGFILDLSGDIGWILSRYEVRARRGQDA